MTVPELSVGALRTKPAERAGASAAPPSVSMFAAPLPAPADTAWLREATPTEHDVEHAAPAHVARPHLSPVQAFASRDGVLLTALAIRAAVIVGLIALLYVAIADGWIGAATQALSDWWAADIAPYFAIDVLGDSGSGGSVPAGR